MEVIGNAGDDYSARTLICQEKEAYYIGQSPNALAAPPP
jgi:hypothetical protein